MGHSWSFVVTRGQSWSFVVTRGHSWSFVVTRGHSCVLLDKIVLNTSLECHPYKVLIKITRIYQSLVIQQSMVLFVTMRKIVK